MTQKHMKHAYYCVHNGGLVASGESCGVMERAQMVVCCPSPGQINPIPDASAELL